MTGQLAELRRQNSAAAWSRDPQNPDFQVKAAHADLLAAQAGATRNKPEIPEMAKFGAFRDMRQQAEDAMIAAEQSGDPVAVRKAQKDVDMAERVFESFLKTKDDKGQVDDEVDGSGRLISRRIKRPYDAEKDAQPAAPRVPVAPLGQQKQRVTIKSQQEFNALPPGTPFIFNGRTGVKN